MTAIIDGSASPTFPVPLNKANGGTNTTTYPAFSAYQSAAQTIPSGPVTKLRFQTKEFDTTTAFDATTNYRFQPTVSGYYQISGAFTVNTSYTGGAIAIYKNGSAFKLGTSNQGGANANIWEMSALVYLNGSTDYVELWGSVITGQALATGPTGTYFQGILIQQA